VTVLLAVMLFISRGFLNLLVVPMWEGFDEPFHYAYLQYIAEHGELPPLNAPSVSQEILESLQLHPTTHWLSALTPIRLRQSLISIERSSRFQLTDLNNYETQHPPLYYLLCVPVYLLGRDLPLIERVFLIRVFSLLLAALSLPLGYLLARRIFKSGYAVLVPAFMALFPNYYVFVGRVTNDAFAVVLFPLLILVSGKLQEKSSATVELLSLGCLLGLGLLTKAYFLSAVPVLLLIVLLRRLRGESTSKVWGFEMFLLLLPPALLAGWWYWKYLAYGTFSGLSRTGTISSLPLSAWIKALPHLRLGQSGKAIFQLHLWAGNWSVRGVSESLYQLFGVVYALCGLGIIRLYVKNRLVDDLESDQDRESRRYLMISTYFFLSFLAGLFYLQWVYAVAGTFIDRQFFVHLGSGGWYLNVLLPVEATLVFLGIRGLVGKQMSRGASLTVLVLFALLDQIALWSRQIPYYAGLSIRIAHPMANPADTVQQLVSALALAFHRVAFLGPNWSSATLLLTLIIVTLGIEAATLGWVYRCLGGTVPNSKVKESGLLTATEQGC
jgi:4-amino-4-deoxy-L-arabinose transferase-like glycosyltransferase